jgi:hypothetical protein
MSDAPEPNEAPENKPVPATRTPNHIPRYKVVGKIEFEMTKDKMDEARQEIDERGTRTPEELKIANDAWFDCGPGEATP